MKITTSLSAILAGLAFAASATPVGHLLPRSDDVRVYKLKIVAPAASDINGKFLSIQPDGEVGVFYSGGSAASAEAVPAPAQFTFAVSDPEKQYYEVHTYPTGIIDHALALYGTGGLRDLRDVVNPGAATNESEYKIDWQSFTLGGPGDGSGNGLSYANLRGDWILFQVGTYSYSAAWYDGTSFITQNYQHVDIAYVEV